MATIELNQGSPLNFPADGLDFKWHEGKPARVMFYRFKLSQDKSFEKPLVSVDIKQHSYHVARLSSGHYFWKVGVKYKHDVPIVYSAIREFTLQPADKPAVIVTPNDGETADEATDEGLAAKIEEPSTPQSKENLKQDQAPTPRVAMAPPAPPPPELTQPLDGSRMETLATDKILMLHWHSSTPARKFLVEIAKKADFADATQVHSEAMRLSVTFQPGRYFWRVSALDERGQKGPASTARSFELVNRKIDISLLSPEKNQQFDYIRKAPAVLFGWRVADSNATSFTYRLEIARDVGFANIVAQRALKAPSATLDDLGDGAYFWRIGAQFDPNLPMQFSENGTFTISKKTIAIPPPALREPADAARIESVDGEQPISLRWSNPPNCGGFIVELAAREDFSGAETFTLSQPALDIKRGRGRYFWRVKALNEAREEGVFSAPRSFNIVMAQKSVALKDPGAAATLGAFEVNFLWEPLADCVSYRLIVSANNTMASPLRELETKDNVLHTKLDDEDRLRCGSLRSEQFNLLRSGVCLGEPAAQGHQL